MSKKIFYILKDLRKPRPTQKKYKKTKLAYHIVDLIEMNSNICIILVFGPVKVPKMVKIANLVKNYHNDKSSTSKCFLQFKLIAIIKHKIETLGIRKPSCLVMTPLNSKVAVNLDVVK